MTTTEQLVWRKASASAGAGQCVELAAIPPGAWADSCTSSGNCVQLAPHVGGVAMRDSKHPDGPMLHFTKAELAAFIDGAKAGEFDGLTKTDG